MHDSVDFLFVYVADFESDVTLLCKSLCDFCSKYVRQGGGACGGRGGGCVPYGYTTILDIGYWEYMSFSMSLPLYIDCHFRRQTRMGSLSTASTRPFLLSSPLFGGGWSGVPGTRWYVTPRRTIPSCAEVWTEGTGQLECTIQDGVGVLLT